MEVRRCCLDWQSPHRREAAREAKEGKRKKEGPAQESKGRRGGCFVCTSLEVCAR